MSEVFIEISPRIWMPTKESIKGFHIVTSPEELRTIVMTQALYDNFDTYKKVYDFYYTHKPDIKDPTIPDFFPRFQLNLLKALQKRDEIVKKKELEKIIESANRRLNFDDELVQSMLMISQELTGVNKVTLNEHIIGERGYARNLDIYEGLSSLDEHLDDSFFRDAYKNPRHNILQKYNAALSARLENRSKGIVRNKPLKTGNTIIPKNDIAKIEELAQELGKSFPKAKTSVNNKYGSHKPSVGIPLPISKETTKKVPYFKKKSELIDDYSILTFLFDSIVSDYSKAQKDANPKELIDELYRYAISQKSEDKTDLIMAYENGDIDNQLNLEGTLNKVVSTLSVIYAILPSDAFYYLEYKADYEISWLRKELKLWNNLDEQMRLNKYLKQTDKNLKKRKNSLIREGIIPSNKEFVEHISNLELYTSDWKDIAKSLSLFNKIGVFFTSDEIKNCIDQYTPGMPQEKFQLYFANTIQLNNADKK